MPSNIDLLKGKIRMYIEATGDAGIKNIGLDREDDLRRARRALAVFYHPDRARTGDLRTVLGRISGDVNNILDDMIFYNTNKHTPINQLKRDDRARLNEISRDVTKEDIKSGTEETKKMLDEQKRLRSRKLTKKELEEEIEEERIVQEVRRLRKAPENPQHSAIGPFDEKGRKYKSEPFEGQTSGRRTLVTRPFGEGNKKHESEPMGEKGRRFASEPMGEKGKRYESEPMGEKGKRYRSEPMWEPEEKPPEKPKEEKKPKNHYRIYVDSYPNRKVEIKFYYHSKKKIEPKGIGPDSDFEKIVSHWGARSPAAAGIAADIRTTAAEFQTKIARTNPDRFRKEEDAEKWLKSRLSPVFAGTRYDMAYWIELIISSLWVEPPGFILKEVTIGDNKTPITADLEEGIWILEAEASKDGFAFDRWEVRAPDGTILGTKAWKLDEDRALEDKNKTRLVLTDELEQILRPARVEGNGNVRPVRAVAYYYKKAEHQDRPHVRSPYQRGAAEGGYGKRASNSMVSALGLKGVRQKIERSTEPRKLSDDPFMNAAANKGKRILNQYAKAEYTRIFNPLVAEYRRRARELRDLERLARTARRNLTRLIRQNRRAVGYKSFVFHRTDEDKLNTADRLMAPGAALEGSVAMQEARDTLRRFIDTRDKYYEDFKRDFESASAHLKDYLVNKAGVVTTQLARRYKMPVNGADEGALGSALNGYAGVIAEDFATRGRTLGFALVRGLGAMSRGLETGGAVMQTAFHNLFSLIFGPWTWTSLFVLLLYFFTLTYIGYNPIYLWIMPVIAGGVVWLLNFEDFTKPLDWVTHFASGAIIGYAALLLMLSLHLNTFLLDGTFSFWVAWAVLCFFGIFQFYQVGGYKIALQGGIIILLFAYIAFGPYSGYYNQAIDQIKGPVEVAYHAVSKSVGDVYLLATNPTEWYARQQVQNVRPEKSLTAAKGVEVNLFDSLPASVPGGQEFALTTVLKHEGALDEATDISVSFSCNQWCGNDDVAYAETNTPVGEQQYKIRDRLLKGESAVASFSGFKAKTISGRENEYRVAKVTMNISYKYSTASSIFVEVINDKELNKRINEGKNFRNVVAVGKNGPAQLSLNVGPQPLVGGRKALLLVAVSNSRDESAVILYDGYEIVIRMPTSIGSNLDCDGYTGANDGQYETVRYKVAPRTTDRIEIRSSDFNSIFPFICNFDVRDIGDDEPLAQSGLVTAEIPSYEFTTIKEKDIPVTVPLGILFDPFDAVCRQCGEGLCDRDECHRLSDEGVCYYESSAGIGGETVGSEGVNMPFAQACRSCGENPVCEQFKTEDACMTESLVCDAGLSCEWTEPTTLSVGRCTTKEVRIIPAGPVLGKKVEKVAEDCSGVRREEVTEFNKYAEAIASHPGVAALEKTTYKGSPVDGPALVGALISHESNWVYNAVSPCGAAGLGQIIRGTATDEGLVGPYELEVPNYGTSKTQNSACGGLKVSNCRDNVQNCRPSTDERFNPEKNLMAAIQYLAKGAGKCNSVTGALKRYYSGQCDGGGGKQEARTYANGILNKYENWLACIEKSREPVAYNVNEWKINNAAPGEAAQFGDISGANIRVNLAEVLETPSGFTVKLNVQREAGGFWGNLVCRKSGQTYSTELSPDGSDECSTDGTNYDFTIIFRSVQKENRQVDIGIVPKQLA